MKFRRKGVIALTAALCVALFASATMAATTVSTLEELKAASTLNETGTEIGWFDAFDENGLLVVSMVENVKGKGGSHYLLPKVKTIFE